MRPTGFTVLTSPGGDVGDAVSHEGATSTCGEGKLIRTRGGTLAGISRCREIEGALREDPRQEGVSIFIEVQAGGGHASWGARRTASSRFAVMSASIWARWS